jgi:hypothetical protein
MIWLPICTEFISTQVWMEIDITQVAEREPSLPDFARVGKFTQIEVTTRSNKFSRPNLGTEELQLIINGALVFDYICSNPLPHFKDPICLE